MDTIIEKVKAHVTAWKLEYICLGCYLAGYFHLVGKVFKALAKYAG